MHDKELQRKIGILEKLAHKSCETIQNLKLRGRKLTDGSWYWGRVFFLPDKNCRFSAMEPK